MNHLRARFNLTTFTVLLLTLFMISALMSATDLFSVPVTASVSRHEVRATSPTGAALPLDQASQARICTAYGKLPMSFEANRGQTDAQVKFLTRGDGYSLFLTSSETVLSLSKPVTGTKATASPAAKGKGGELQRRRARPDVVRMRLAGANPLPNIYGVEELPGKSNYLIGNDPRQWHTGVAHYAKVKYEAVYRGVDVVYYGNQQQLEYDFIVAPSADPRAIKLAFAGTRSIEIDADGELVLKTRSGEVRQRKPFIYQEVNGERNKITGHYVKRGKHQVGFEVGEYDRRLPLVIDPVLVYSTYLGGSAGDQGLGIALDAAGNAYVAGGTGSPLFPTTAGAFDPSVNGGGDAFVTKFDASGSFLIYSTYLGGSGIGSDTATDIAVDEASYVYLTGWTTSNNLPTTSGAFDLSLNGGGDAFVTKLDPSGSALVYSTYLGGAGDGGAGSTGEGAHRIAIDGAGSAYITGETPTDSFPTTPGAFDRSYNGGADAFVTKLNPSGSALVYSTFLGGFTFKGPSRDAGYDIAVDVTGNAYVSGETASSNFPVTPNAFDTSINGRVDAFVTKLNLSGSTVVYSTFLGGSENDYGYGITIDGMGSAYVTGATGSVNFPKTPGAFDITYSGDGAFDVFVTKFNDSGSALIYSTYLGGSMGGGSGDIGYSIAIDAAGNAYVTGETSTPGFPTTPDAFDASFNGSGGTSALADAFVSKLNAVGTALLYSTFLGGTNTDRGRAIAVSATGSVYVTGQTFSSDFPTTTSTFDLSFNGGGDVFVTKLSEPTPTPTPCPTVVVNPSIATAGIVGAPYSLTFTSTGGSAPYTFASSGNLPPGLSLSNNGQLAGTPTTIGTFNFSVTASDTNGCTGTRGYTLVVNCPTITFSPSVLPAGTVGTVYDQFVIPGGGTAPYTFMTSGSLPPGIALDIAGRLSGTPSASGSFTFTVTATDAFGCAGNVTYTVTINPAATPTPTPIPTPTPTPTPIPEPCNVALAANGATVTASSQLNQDYPVNGALDGEHDGNNWGMGGGWNDATLSHFPDSLEVTFSSAKTIQEVVIYTLKNQPNDGSSVNESTLATAYGIRNFTLQYRSELGFVPLPIGLEGGSVSGNTLAKRRFVFSPVTTDKIRIIVHDSADHLYSRIVEIEAYTCAPVVPTPTPTPTPTPILGNGKIAFESNRDGNFEVYIMSPDGGNQTRLSNNTADDRMVAFSPDGTKIVFCSDRDGNYEVYVMNVDGTNQTRLTTTPQNELWPSFSPDGSKIAYNRGTGNASEIFVMNADGTNSAQITSNSFADDEPRWSPNGTRIVFHSTRHNPNYEIYVMNADGTSVDRLTNNNVVDAVGSFSLDGTKILFISNRSGNYEIMVMNIDGSNPINLSRSTSTSDASCRWSADGTKIIFVAARDGNAEIYSMNADGTGQTRLTINTAVDEYPAWQPVWQ